MTAKWEKTSANVGVLEVEVETAAFTEALDVAFKKVVKNVNVPGFRKGKVPRRLFESRFGVESLYQEAIDYLLPRAYTEAVSEVGLNPVDRPDVNVVQVELGKPFLFKATVTVKPEVVLGEYKGAELQDKAFDVTEEAIQEEIDRIRSSHAEIDVVEDGLVTEGDTVNIDFLGKVEGEEFEGGEAENYQLEIGSGMFVKGFEEQLIGLNAGTERDIEVTFPEDYHVKSLATKPASFHVKLHDIKRKSLRELTDDFVQEISEFKTADEFVEDVKQQLASRLEREHQAHLEEQAVQAAVDVATIEIPDVMIEHEVDHQIQNFGQQLQMQQIPLDSYLEFTGTTQDDLRNQFRESAARNVRTALVLEAIADAEELNPTDEDIEKELQGIAESANLDILRVRQLLTQRDPGFDNMKSDLRNRRTVTFLVENGKVV